MLRFFLVMFLACICPILSYPCILMYFRETGQTKVSAVLAGLASSAFMYGYEGDRGNDIIRHMLNLKYYKHISFMDAFDAGFLPMVYVWDIWQWIIAQMNNDFLMQASGAFVGYSLVAYMIFDYGKRCKLSWKAIKVTFVISFLSLSPLVLAIGVRSGNALIFGAFAMYLYFVHEKSWLFTLSLIAISAFLHHSMIIIFAFWLFFLFIRKHTIYGTIIIVLLLFSLTNYESYINMFMGNRSLLEPLGADLQKSVVAYTRDISLSIHYIVLVALQVLLVVLLFMRGGGAKLLSFRNNSELVKDDNSIKYQINQFQLVYLALVFCFLILLSYNGHRFLLISLVLSFLPFLSTVESFPFLRNKHYWFYDFLIFGVLLGTVLLNCYDLNYGTGSLVSFFKSGFFGYLSRLLF